MALVSCGATAADAALKLYAVDANVLCDCRSSVLRLIANRNQSRKMRCMLIGSLVRLVEEAARDDHVRKSSPSALLHQ